MVEVSNCPICGNQKLQLSIQSKDYTATSEIFNILICKQCELLLTSPRPSETEIARYYLSDSYISHTSRAKNLTDWLYLLARRFTLRQKLSLISKFSSQGKMLDYGCGTGDFIKLLTRKNWETFGVEPSTNARINSDNQIFKSLTEIKQKEFNIITLWHVLEHVPDLNGLLRQLNERLSKDGTIFIAVPNYKSFDAIHYKESWAGYDVPRHLWHFSKQSIMSLLEKNALKLITIKPMMLDSIYVSQLSEKYLNNNKLTIGGFIKGSIIGLRSNIAAFTTKEYSSLIYIVQK